MPLKIAILSPGRIKVIAYHNVCKINYNNRARTTIKKEPRPWH